MLHGDLHGKNVLVGRSGVALIDLDQVAVGPPAAELGSAAAALRHDRLTGGLPPSSPLEDQLLAGYRSAAVPPPPPTLAWFTAAALLGERALRAVNRVRPDGLSALPRVLQSARQLLEDRPC